MAIVHPVMGELVHCRDETNLEAVSAEIEALIDISKHGIRLQWQALSTSLILGAVNLCTGISGPFFSDVMSGNFSKNALPDEWFAAPFEFDSEMWSGWCFTLWLCMSQESRGRLLVSKKDEMYSNYDRLKQGVVCSLTMDDMLIYKSQWVHLAYWLDSMLVYVFNGQHYMSTVGGSCSCLRLNWHWSKYLGGSSIPDIEAAVKDNKLVARWTKETGRRTGAPTSSAPRCLTTVL
ncbi:hypothetical protein WH47_04715 [Habropoda laboriosa]|uniref:Uncharacterized protein n=1 Tax=Habropoda laboriosa TaxID=597456 RepID=A0A0L7QXN4_9HYME|nr:hypothetical protein WH47_04715 [Habropoda laboriosa]